MPVRVETKRPTETRRKKSFMGRRFFCLAGGWGGVGGLGTGAASCFSAKLLGGAASPAGLGLDSAVGV